MKTKKVLLVVAIMGIILMLNPAEVFGWLVNNQTYEAYNGINIFISNVIKIIALIVAISYISVADMYFRHSKDDKEQKKKNILKWLGLTLAQILALACLAIWIRKVGLETYFVATGERVQPSILSGYVSIILRVSSLIVILFYIISSIIYYFKSQKESEEKLTNIVKYQIITSIIIVVLLLCARIW